jgi:hypothetical protein
MEAADRLCGKQDGYALLVNSNTILSNTELHTEKKILFVNVHNMSWHKYNTRFFNYDSTNILVGASRHRLLKPLHWVYALSFNEGPI